MNRQHHRRLATAILLIALAAVGACSADPGSPPSASGAAAGTSKAEPVADQRGFAIPTYDRDGYDSDELEQYLEQIAGTGAGWVQLNPTWYQDAPTSNDVTEREDTPTDASVENAVAQAHEAGLKVLLKPHVDIPDGTPRGEIVPAARAAWFASYTAFIDHYGDLAGRTGVDQFAVGTELEGVSGDRDGWLGVVEAVRARYSGPLLYAANYDEYADVAFWDAVDLVGIDAYFPLADVPTADTATLEQAWAPIRDELAAFAASTGKRILFTEAGYTSQHGSTTAPYSWTISDQPDQEEQAAGYEALLTSFYGQPWWAGVFWWSWNVPLDDVSNDPLGYTPRGKAAEDVLRHWWT